MSLLIFILLQRSVALRGAELELPLILYLKSTSASTNCLFY